MHLGRNPYLWNRIESAGSHGRTAHTHASDLLCSWVEGLQQPKSYIYPHGTRHLHTVAALPPLIPIPPPHSCTATCCHSPRRTINDTSPSSIMSLFALFLEALAGTVTILSAPKLLDRVLTHLCRWPFPDICIALTKCSQHGCYHWGPASHSGILPAFLPDH
jgi:hypothetical protein